MDQSKPLFVLTNDPDHGNLEQTKRVFQLLNRHKIRVTHAVFNKVRESNCDLGRHCYPQETADLSNPAYVSLMQEQQALGHEIAWHGYSQTGETRGEFIAGLAQFRGYFGRDPYTYIEHGPNPHTHPNQQHKPNLLAAAGSDPSSPHYVLDLIQKHITLVWTQTDLLGKNHPHQPHGPLLPSAKACFVKRPDGLIHFLRYRLYIIQHQPFEKALHAAQAPFVGYTHFGYPYSGHFGRWGSERWDDLDVLNAHFLARVAADYQFKTLEAFHKEHADAGFIPESDHQLGPQTPHHLPDPLELLDLPQRAEQLKIPPKMLRKGALLNWSATLHVLKQLLQGSNSVLFVGDQTGTLSIPLAAACGFQLTLVTKDTSAARENSRILAPAHSCRMIQSADQTLPAGESFDAVVLTADAEVNTGGLQRAHQAANSILIVAHDQPLPLPFQHWNTPKNTTINWIRPRGVMQRGNPT